MLYIHSTSHSYLVILGNMTVASVIFQFNKQMSKRTVARNFKNHISITFMITNYIKNAFNHQIVNVNTPMMNRSIIHGSGRSTYDRNSAYYC